jgi:hypothetical protein
MSLLKKLNPVALARKGLRRLWRYLSVTLIEKLKALWDRDRDKLTYVRFDPSHVDRKLNTQPIQAGKHYFRLRLAELFLTKQVQAGKNWYPAVHSLVQLNFGN